MCKINISILTIEGLEIVRWSNFNLQICGQTFCYFEQCLSHFACIVVCNNLTMLKKTFRAVFIVVENFPSCCGFDDLTFPFCNLSYAVNFYMRDDLLIVFLHFLKLLQIADVWSCGVTLYVMLVGAYPFEDPEEPKNFRKTIQVTSYAYCYCKILIICLIWLKSFPVIQRILNVQYSIPDYVHISPECRHLISRIFVADPAKVISVSSIQIFFGHILSQYDLRSFLVIVRCRVVTLWCIARNYLDFNPVLVRKFLYSSLSGVSSSCPSFLLLANPLRFVSLFCLLSCLVNIYLWYLDIHFYLSFQLIYHHAIFFALQQRISIPEIKNHEWFLKNLPADLMDNTTNNQFEEPDQRMQSIDEIMQIITEATIPAAGTNSLNHYLTGSLDIDDDMEEDLESDPDLDIDSSGEIVYAM